MHTVHLVQLFREVVLHDQALLQELFLAADGDMKIVEEDRLLMPPLRHRKQARRGGPLDHHLPLQLQYVAVMRAQPIHVIQQHESADRLPDILQEIVQGAVCTPIRSTWPCCKRAKLSGLRYSGQQFGVYWPVSRRARNNSRGTAAW